MSKPNLQRIPRHAKKRASRSMLAAIAGSRSYSDLSKEIADLRDCVPARHLQHAAQGKWSHKAT